MPSYFFADLVRETSSTTGSGPLSLSGAVPGHQRFADIVPPGTSFYYAIAGISQPDQWETGIGSFGGDGLLHRGEVKASSAGGEKIDFATGLKTVALTVGAGWFAGQQNAVDALALTVADKQPLATGHQPINHAASGDLVTVRRGEDWFNLPLGAVLRRAENGRFAPDAPIDLTAGSAANPALAWHAAPGVGLFRADPAGLGFATAGIEKMRISGEGWVGIGTSNPSCELHIHGNAEMFRQSTSTVRGSGANYAAFFDPSGSKGFYGYAGSDDTFFIMNEMNASLRFGTNGAVKFTIDVPGNLCPQYDNTQTLGSASSRMAVVYAGTGTINTSDAREKSWRGGLTHAEQRAARRIAREIGVYQWNSAIAEKGKDGARLHVGVPAQNVWAIMADEGLVDPIGADGTPGKTPFAFLCWDAPDGDDGRQASGRFGVRNDQLALFVAAALAERIETVEARPGQLT